MPWLGLPWLVSPRLLPSSLQPSWSTRQNWVGGQKVSPAFLLLLGADHHLIQAVLFLLLVGLFLNMADLLLLLDNRLLLQAVLLHRAGRSFLFSAAYFHFLSNAAHFLLRLQ